MKVKSLKQMCEFISQTIEEKSGRDVSPKEIFDSDPNGDFFHIPILYELALKAK